MNLEDISTQNIEAVRSHRLRRVEHKYDKVYKTFICDICGAKFINSQQEWSFVNPENRNFVTHFPRCKEYLMDQALG